MRRVLIGLIVVAALFISGCSDTGILRISNWSSYNAKYILGGDEYEISPGYSQEYEWDLSTSIFGIEKKKVNVEISGTYVFNEVIRKTIKPGSTVKIDIYTNAGGIRVENWSYSKSIKEVYISPHSDDEWGDNDLSGVIGPGQSVSWYVTPGSWDIKIVDDWDIELDFFADVELEETIVFTYYGSKSTGDSNELKIANAQKTTQSIEDRVQQNDK